MYGIQKPDGRYDPCICADEALRFLQRYTARGWQGRLSVMALASDGSTKTQTVSIDRIEDLWPFIEARNGTCNLFFGVNPVTEKYDKKAAKAGIAALAYLHVDLDPRDDLDLNTERDRIRKLIDEFPIKPNLIIDSGGGFQVFWRLLEPVLANGNIERLEGYSRRLAAHFGADHCWNIDRLMRLPGTVNLPNPRKRANGRHPAFAQLVWSDEGAYSLEDFDFLQNGAEGAQAQEGNHGGRPTTCVDDLRISDALKQLIRQGRPKGRRSEAVFSVLRAMVNAGHSDAEMAAVLMDTANALSAKPSEKGPAWLQGEIYRARTKPDRDADGSGAQADESASRHRDHSAGPSAAQADPSDGASDASDSAGKAGGTQPRFKLLNSDDLSALPPLAWCVRGVLPAQGLAALYGPSGSGKSFLALDMAAAIAEGCPWFGRSVKAAHVVYVALEGEAGFRLRVAAWEARNRRKLPYGLGMVLQAFKLPAPQDVNDLAAVVPAGALVFLDTLNRAAPTADENSSRDMGEILEAAKRLQSLTGGLVVLIHHTGKDTTRGPRGHSSLFAAVDAAIEVSRDGDRRGWKVSKSKDGADGDSNPFTLEVETLGTDEYGDPITSCVVVPDIAAEKVRRAKMPQGGNQRLVLEALRPMFKTGQTGKPGAPPLQPCIELEAAITAGAAKLSCPSDKRNSRAREAIKGLITRGVLGFYEAWLWMA